MQGPKTQRVNDALDHKPHALSRGKPLIANKNTKNSISLIKSMTRHYS